MIRSMFFPLRRRRLDHLDAEKVVNRAGIDLKSAFYGFIDHVQHDDHREAVLRHLEEEVEVALETSGVRHHDDRIDVLLLQEPADQAFLVRVPPLERIDPPGQVNELDDLALETGVAPRCSSTVVPG